MSEEIRPNVAEIEFLKLAYNRFYDLFEEIMDDSFWDKDEWYRFSKIKDGFAVYTELLHYEPVKWIIEHIRKARPPMEAEIGSDLFKFIRNMTIHFPFFNSWNEVWIKKTIINWQKQGQFIDYFLQKYKDKELVKYRFWGPSKKRMTYLTINFPKEYDKDNKIYLRESMSEKEGAKFSFILMKQILNTQVESISEDSAKESQD